MEFSLLFAYKKHRTNSQKCVQSVLNRTHAFDLYVIFKKRGLHNFRRRPRETQIMLSVYVWQFFLFKVPSFSLISFRKKANVLTYYVSWSFVYSDLSDSSTWQCHYRTPYIFRVTSSLSVETIYSTIS